jgi:hypothetical protein
MAGLLVGDVSGHMASFSQPKRPISCSVEAPYLNALCTGPSVVVEVILRGVREVEQDGYLM